MGKNTDETLDALFKIKELLSNLSSHENIRVEVESEKVKVLRIALDELRRVHEHVSNAYDGLRTRVLAMLAGQVAIVTFLFSGTDSSRIGIPPDTAGRIFLTIGIVALISSFALFVYLTASSKGWPVPGDINEIEEIDNGNDCRYDTVEKFLLFLRKDYLQSTRECINILEKKAIRFNIALYLLLVSVIILLAIKYGGLH